MLCSPSPVNVGIMLEYGMASAIKGAASARGGPRTGGGVDEFFCRIFRDALIWAQNLR